MRMVRRLLSILLLAVFALPVAVPLFASAQDADAGLPACCRRDGKHHCMMMSMDGHGSPASSEPQYRAPAEKCPYCPASVVAGPFQHLAEPASAAAIFGDLVSHPTGFAQTNARGRISSERSNQKRGPPTQTTA